MEPVNRLRTGLLLMAGAVLVAGIYIAGVRGIADVHYFAARTLLVDAAKSKRLPEPGELTAVEAALRDSLALEPSNPLFVEQLARVHEMRALQLKRGDPAAREPLQRALAQFRAAAMMRPGSPYVWTSIAAIKLRLDDMDYEFYGALQRADRLGRWEPAIQLALADIGLASWRLLARPAKALVLGAIARGLAREGAEIRRIAALHGTLPLVCAEEIRLRGTRSGLCVKK